MNPASAQHAALRILLEDVEPLLQRAEEAAQTLTQVREELNTDLTTLGTLVQQSVELQPLLLEAGRKLSTSAARIEAAMNGNGLFQTKARAATTSLRLWAFCAISATLSGVLVSAAIWIGARGMMEEARVGRALLSVWQSIDATTRIKIHERLGKS